MHATTRNRICSWRSRQKPILPTRFPFPRSFVKKQNIFQKSGLVVADLQLSQQLQKLNKSKDDFVNFAEFSESQLGISEEFQTQEQLEFRQFDQYFASSGEVTKVVVGQQASVCVGEKESGSIDTQDSENEENEIGEAPRHTSFFSSFVEGLKVQCKAYFWD